MSRQIKIPNTGSGKEDWGARRMAGTSETALDLYRAAIDGSADCILLVDRDGKVVLSNRPLPGTGPDRMTGQHLVDCIPESWRSSVAESLAAASEGEPRQFELESDRPTGVPLVISWRVAPVRGTQEVQWIVINASDVSERRARLTEMRQSADRYRFLAETISDVIWTMDLDQRITYVSPSIQPLVGYTVDEMQKMELREILSPESFALAREILLEELRFEYQPDTESSLARTVDLQLVRKDASTVWCEARMSFLRDPRGRPEGVVGLARDISAWREAQEALEASEERLRRAQRLEAVGQLAGGIAHDFNNLLTVIIGNVELMLHDLSSDDPRHSQASEISKAAGRAAGLTRQLLAFSRKQMMMPKVIGLNGIIEEMAGMLRGLVGENIEIRLDLYPALAKVKADPSQMELVLVNLALNARDAMPEGGSLVIETANSHLDQTWGKGEFEVIEGPYVGLAVTDSGVGIDLADQAKIFEPFFTTKEVGKGTGLGLSTVYGIVKQSGGYIFVSSRPHQGTRFEIYLPLVDAVGKSPREDPQAEVARTVGERILVVEDEDSVRNLTRKILVDRGFEVLEANRAGPALDVLRDKTQKIDLLLTDVIMPGMSGTRLAREAQALRPDLKVLFMSGHNEEMLHRHTDIEQGRNLLPKPFSPDDLAEIVARALEGEVSLEGLEQGAGT